MAMNLGSSSSSGDPEPIMDINTTPLIDVMLVLLVMLIITIPIQLHSVNLNLPVGTPPPSQIKPEVVKIDIDEQSRIYWQGLPVADRAELEAKMQAAAAQAVQPEIHVRPHKLALYNTFAEVMVSANHAGLSKLGVVGSEQFIGQ
ncbi:MAG: ExbD/TolR family protein [Leptothrix sp. (in: b-proteobacteria)]